MLRLCFVKDKQQQKIFTREQPKPVLLKNASKTQSLTEHAP